MLYKFDWVESKNPNWKIVTITEAIENGQTLTDVSINKTNKDGSIAFPDFDTFMPGGTVQGNPWRNPTTGKLTLYADRPAPKSDAEVTARQTPPNASNPSYVPRPSFGGGAMATKAANISVAQDRKNEAIEKAQENKGHAIKIAAAMRDATLITIALMGGVEETERADFQANFKAIKEWYLGEWDNTEKGLDVPF